MGARKKKQSVSRVLDERTEGWRMLAGVRVWQSTRCCKDDGKVQMTAVHGFERMK